MSVRGNVDAQSLDERVRFERKTATRTATGAVVESWAPLKECWARVDGAKASAPEPMVDGGIRIQRDYTVWVRSDVFTRYRITPLDRVAWKGQIMDIRDIPDQGLRGRIIAVIVRSGVNKG